MPQQPESTDAVLVTGGARRVGAAIAGALAEAGWRVFLHYHRSVQAAEALAQEIERKGGRCTPLQADLARIEEVTALIPRCLAQVGALRCLVNNASAFERDSIASLSPESWARHLAPNLTAPAFLAKSFAEQADGSRDNVIINMLDQKVRNLNPDYFSYTISKLGLLGLTETLALALAPAVRVCGIAPGITLPSGAQTEAQFARAWQAPPLGRSTSPEEIALAVKFILATPSMTGNILYLDGGESLTKRARDVAFEVE
ncbi:MAG TPA: SDR family oxidoreductase [Alphaproteobacteria bacterium]|nr:SDR family oxidoreductase [Alphaproteobacteria bacterium]